MKRINSVLLVCILLSTVGAIAETTELSVAFVNMERIASEYDEFADVLKNVDGEIKAAQEEDMAKLTEYNNTLTELETKLNGPLTDEAKQTTYDEYVRIANEALAFRENAFARYEQMQVDALQVVYKKVYAKVTSIAQAEGYDVVFDSMVFAYVDETDITDVTDQVLEELNAEYGIPGGE